MNYIWEILLKARQTGYFDKDLFFVQAKECSPWYEQSFPCINENMISNPVIEINALYRFSDIFQELLYYKENSEYLTFLFDAAIHILAAQETLKGLSKRDFYIKKLIKDLEKGEFSFHTANTFQKLEENKKRYIADLILSQYEIGSSLMTFRKAVTLFYPKAMLYQIRYKPQQLLLYLGLTNAEREVVQMLEELFLPIQYQIRIFWNKHFGVWDVDATLLFDEIEIY